MFSTNSFISGEQFQQLCDVYCGTAEFLLYNPTIVEQPEKHMYLERLDQMWNNPRIVFCYSSCLKLFEEKLKYFQNPFVLVSHNGDENIDDSYKAIAEHPLLLYWFAQNLVFEHSKVHWLPIGIANAMWPHGNKDALQYVLDFSLTIPKEKDIYFFFALHTNEKERKSCKKILEAKGLHYGDVKPYVYYLQDLASHRFCISPPGNGIDCHRIWESFYFGTIPILLRSTFTERIAKYFPCILLDSWDQFHEETIIQSYDPSWRQKAQESSYLYFETWKQLILGAGHQSE